MQKQFEKFEKLIERIHNLIEQKDSKVTWNDMIPDPDNPSQPRQIDVSIKRGNILTIIECRIHDRPQNVKWIEELIGRRISLEADTMIAVSASGFSKGAVTKAKKYGIILRDLLSLTEKEVKNWGHKTKITVHYVKYKNLILDILFNSKFENCISDDDLFLYLSEKDIFKDILGQMKKAVKTQKLKEKYQFLIVELLMKKRLLVGDAEVLKMYLHAQVKKIIRNLKIPSVVVYGDPEESVNERGVKLEQDEDGGFNIKKTSKEWAMTIDLSLINHPTSSYLESIYFDLGKPLQLKYTEIIGYDSPIINNNLVLIRKIFDPIRFP